jgi:hypothetical protein
VKAACASGAFSLIAIRGIGEATISARRPGKPRKRPAIRETKTRRYRGKQPA